MSALYKSLLSVVNIVTDSVQVYDGLRKYLKTGNLNNNSEIVVEEYPFNSKPSRANQNVKTNDVILARMKETNKVLRITEDYQDIIVSTGFVVLRPDETKISSEYLEIVLKSRQFQYQKDKYCSGATQKAINNAKFVELKIPVPNISEQKYIVQVLKSVEAIIEKRQTQIATLDELMQNVFLKMFGDPVLNTNKYPVNSLENYIDFLTSGSRGWSKYFTNTGQYFITIKNVKKGNLIFDDITYVNPPETKEATRTKIREKDLLISITADLGRTAVVDKETAMHGGYINQHLSLIRLNNQVSPVYISAFLESMGGKLQFEKLNQNGVKAGLNFELIKSLKIMMPPLKEQQIFETRLVNIKKQKVKLLNSLRDYENLYTSFLQKAFNSKEYSS